MSLPTKSYIGTVGFNQGRESEVYVPSSNKLTCCQVCNFYGSFGSWSIVRRRELTDLCKTAGKDFKERWKSNGRHMRCDMFQV